MKQKICVIEVNEVPLIVWETYSATFPNSAVAQFFSQGKHFTTLADDIEIDKLYPSQTWASLNTGLPYSEHKIYWYNDSKSELKQFWWHHAALIGKKVGLVNVLHTSPMNNLLREANYSFLIPDCFASDCETLPKNFESFQKLNIQMTQKNGRTSTSGISDLLGLAFRSFFQPSNFGLSLFTIWQTFRALPSIINSRERLRRLQFPPIASIFLKLIRDKNPDIAIIFTNHIAAFQHRYWYALFPKDYSENIYSEQWVEKYRNDIIDSVGLLDAYLIKMMSYCKTSDRILVLASSMGQHANQKLKPETVASASWDFRLDAPQKIIPLVLGHDMNVRFEGAMVPQYTFAFNDRISTDKASVLLHAWLAENHALDGAVDINGVKITLTVKVNQRVKTLLINGKPIPIEAFGFIELEIDDHHSGCHQPQGVLAIWNDRSDSLFPSKSTPSTFSYLNYATEMLRYIEPNNSAATG